MGIQTCLARTGGHFTDVSYASERVTQSDAESGFNLVSGHQGMKPRPCQYVERTCVRMSLTRVP
ncbi:protein of unknown function [Nitrospira japonica]|uniref:Uncharacterized protein n=1 Tax=Nitrospira japonica TaxID=1325564 RepID=A0A1W1IAX3_9BACT|nr:protein of unknown function [Nitrospira japonica]